MRLFAIIVCLAAIAPLRAELKRTLNKYDTRTGRSTQCE
jgi:hypothetical protein